MIANRRRASATIAVGGLNTSSSPFRSSHFFSLFLNWFFHPCRRTPVPLRCSSICKFSPRLVVPSTEIRKAQIQPSVSCLSSRVSPAPRTLSQVYFREPLAAFRSLPSSHPFPQGTTTWQLPNYPKCISLDHASFFSQAFSLEPTSKKDVVLGSARQLYPAALIIVHKVMKGT